MEKRNFKIISVVALFIAVVALSIGFAAYSATLNIQDATGTVTATDTFSPKVQYKLASVECTSTNGEKVQNSGSLESDTNGYRTIWKDVEITLSQGESVTCTATVENKSTFVAYLNGISTSSALSCEAADGTTQNVNEACAGLTFSVSGGNTSVNVPAGNTINKTDITNETIAADGEAEVSFTISYPQTAAVTDGDFTISIPTISFLYETND